MTHTAEAPSFLTIMYESDPCAPPMPIPQHHAPYVHSNESFHADHLQFILQNSDGVSGVALTHFLP